MTHFSKATAIAAVAIGTVAATTTPGFAGGDVIDYGSGLARHRAAVPVPAPTPVPEISTGYYLRVDAAYSMSDTDKYRSTSWQADAARTDSYLNNFPRYGFGVGYQFSSWFRMDATYDWRRDVKSGAAGLVSYSVPNTAGGVGTNPSIAMRDTIMDNFTSTNATGMINAYVDAPGWHNFTPYFGLGIGFVRHQLKGRTFTRTIQCIDALDCDPNTAGPQLGVGGGSYSVRAGENSVGLAFAAMLGASYKIWDNTKLDIGYRFLHLEGAKVAGRSADLVNFENLIIPEQNIHELRAGLRFEIN